MKELFLGVRGMYTYPYWSYTNENFRTKFAEWYQTAAPRPYVGILLAGWVALIVGFKYSPSDASFWKMDSAGSFVKWCHADIQGQIVWD